MSPNPSFYVMIVFLIAIITSPTINLVLASSSTNKSTSSSYPKSNITLSIPSTPQRDNNNLTSTFEITDQIKALIDDRLDKNKTNAAIVIGFIDPNGTQFYGHGKMSNSSNATVDENTVFPLVLIPKYLLQFFWQIW